MLEHLQKDSKDYSQTIISIAGVVLLLALVYVTLPVMSPFVVVGAILFLLYPYRFIPSVRRIMSIGVILFFVWFFSTISSVLVPFVVALLGAYILNPSVSWLERKKIPRWGGSLIILALLLGVIVTSIVLLMPIIFAQFQNILVNISATLQENIGLIKEGKLFDILARYGVPVEPVREFLEKELPQRLESALKPIVEGIFTLLTSITTILTQLLNVVIIPFLMFYLMKDFREIVSYVESLLPEQKRSTVHQFLVNVDGALGQYFRGAILIALIQGTIATTVLTLLNVPYSLVLGIMTALLDFIPYVGLLVSVVVACTVALLGEDPSLGKMIGVIIMYAAMKIFENGFLAPKIIGSRIGVHPVLLILALFVFGYFLGFVGLLIAVPTTAVLAITFRWWREKNQQAISTPEIIV